MIYPTRFGRWRDKRIWEMTEMLVENRMKYLDGIKLILCYLVMLSHYCMAYIPNGYIGYGSIYVEADKTSAFVENMPFPFFINTAIEIYPIPFLP